MLLLGNLASLSPEAFTDPNAHVRTQVAALLIRQYTGLSLLGRANTFGSNITNRMLMSEISRQSQICVSRYNLFATENRLRTPEIDTRVLRIGAGGIAHHIMRGEFAQARLLEERILAEEAVDELEALTPIIAIPRRDAAAA